MDFTATPYIGAAPLEVRFEDQATALLGLSGLSQTHREWIAMAADPNGDVYAANFNGYIYKRAGGVGDFIKESSFVGAWEGMATTADGDIYATTSGGDIYIQAGGVGEFVGLGLSGTFRGIAVAPNKDIYVCTYNGDIYKRSLGVGAFNPLGQTHREWTGIATAPNGDVYASTYNDFQPGDIYKQTSGVGDFESLAQAALAYRGMGSASNGDVYVCVENDNIYKRSGGLGDFETLGVATKGYLAITVTSDDNFYASVNHEDIYQGTYDEFVSWQWEFGDGGISFDSRPTHVYTAAGKYTVTLTIVTLAAVTIVYTYDDLIIVDDVQIEFEDICLRYATEVTEGYGWAELGGDDFVRPGDPWAINNIVDDNNIPRTILVDKNDFEVYEIDTYDRIFNVKPYALDKQGVEDTEIIGIKDQHEQTVDVADEQYKIKHERSYVYTRPDDPHNRGASGYTATGQRLAQELGFEVFNDGEIITPAAKISNFPESGELCFSGGMERANRIAPRVTVAASEILITGILHEYLAEFRAPERERRMMNEQVLQKELALGKVIHFCRGSGLINRVNGYDYGGGTITLITGADGRDRSGLTFISNVVLNVAAITGDYTAILWAKSATPFTGITGLTTKGVVTEGFTLYYKKGTGGLGAVSLLAGSVFDVRLYSKQLSVDAIDYLYDNTVSFEGKAVLPGF